MNEEWLYEWEAGHQLIPSFEAWRENVDHPDCKRDERNTQ